MGHAIPPLRLVTVNNCAINREYRVVTTEFENTPALTVRRQRGRWALATEHVTSVVRDRFTRETERLHLRSVTLDPARGRRDATSEHWPKVLGATMKVDIDHVLSEGEQTALGLAGFCTEAEFDASKSAVVLDDPVSSRANLVQQSVFAAQRVPPAGFEPAAFCSGGRRSIP